jgi:hypothetical protein
MLIVAVIGGKYGFKIVRSSADRMETATNDQTTQIVSRLDSIEHRLNAQDLRITELGGKVNGVAHTVIEAVQGEDN